MASSSQVPYRRQDRKIAFARKDLERALVALRDSRPLVRTTYGQQHLSKSLIVVFLNELHAKRKTNRFVSIGVSWSVISDFLGGREEHGHRGVFSRFNMRDESGDFHRITTHQFRHWLSTMAKRGGLSEVELARWMGRRRLADNRAYDHRTQTERAEEARELIRAGRAAGPVADAYRSLPPVDGEAFLDAHVNAVLTTPYGMCLHDYGQGPCERHFSCAGCGELLRRKGDPEERAALVAMLARTRRALDAAAAEAADGTYGASNWTARNQRLEIDLITMLAVDDDNTHSDRDLVRVWPQSNRKREKHD